MSDDDHKSWLNRLAQAFSSAPKTQDDIAEVLRIAHSNKILNREALEIMEGALHVSDQQVREIMVPRSQMVVMDADAPLEDILTVAIESNHSRFPVIGESIDDIRGILLAKDLLQVALHGRENFCLQTLLRPATIIPESKRLNVLLREFREQRYHMAVVVDEYGSVSGIVTIEDVLEEIVGDISDEYDEQRPEEIRAYSDGTFIVSGRASLEDVRRTFVLDLESDEVDSIGGYLGAMAGRIPSPGEFYTFSGWRFTILEADERQIWSIKVEPLEHS